jgi:surface protein
MFINAYVFNSDISQWDVSKVTNMRYMFFHATAFNRDISSWDVSKVTDMNDMFRNATAFNRDIGQWNVSSVTSMDRMFRDATAFNGDIGQWNVSSVTRMVDVFANATAFNSDISQWNVSNVTTMGSMFYGAYVFDRDIRVWDVSKVTDMTSMFYGATLMQHNYDAPNNPTNAWFTGPVLISNICFPAGTPITTNQGTVPIEKINPEIHTIRNKPIVGITRTVTQDKYVVCFEKDSLGSNIPSQQTIMSKNHGILYNGKLRKAGGFIGNDNITKLTYNGEILYNVLMEEHDKMIVNNLICETLHPENKIAKLYKVCKNLNSEEKQKLIQNYNAGYKKYLSRSSNRANKTK